MWLLKHGFGGHIGIYWLTRSWILKVRPVYSNPRQNQTYAVGIFKLSFLVFEVWDFSTIQCLLGLGVRILRKLPSPITLLFIKIRFWNLTFTRYYFWYISFYFDLKKKRWLLNCHICCQKIFKSQCNKCRVINVIVHICVIQTSKVRYLI